MRQLNQNYSRVPGRLRLSCTFKVSVFFLSEQLDSREETGVYGTGSQTSSNQRVSLIWCWKWWKATDGEVGQWWISVSHKQPKPVNSTTNNVKCTVWLQLRLRMHWGMGWGMRGRCAGHFPLSPSHVRHKGGVGGKDVRREEWRKHSLSVVITDLKSSGVSGAHAKTAYPESVKKTNPRTTGSW